MYQLSMQVKPEHIDFQNIVDGLYYPFYFEECRHRYLKEVLGIDIEAYAQQGLNLVLTEYTLKFKSSLHRGDILLVSCAAAPEENSRMKFAFKQQIICRDKVAAEAIFIGTCVSAAGGRPFIPDEVKRYLQTTQIAV